MPLFFCISGYLEKDLSLKNTLKKGVKGLIIPYIILYGISFLGWIPSRILWHKEIFENSSVIKELIFKPLLGMLLGVGYNTEFSTMMNIPLWFLVSLFFVKLLHKIFLLLAKNGLNIYMILNILIVIIILILKHFSLDLFFSIDSALLAFPFFTFGFYIHRKNIKFINGILQNNANKASVFLMAVVALIFTIILSNINGNIDINMFNYGKNILLFYITALFGIIMTIGLSTFYNNSFLIRKIASGTILILAFHGYPSALIIRIINMYSKELSIYIAIPISIISTVVMVIPIIIVQKYFPIILGRRE